MFSARYRRGWLRAKWIEAQADSVTLRATLDAALTSAMDAAPNQQAIAATSANNHSVQFERRSLDVQRGPEAELELVSRMIDLYEKVDAELTAPTDQERVDEMLAQIVAIRNIQPDWQHILP